ncbi:NADH:ubiquinone reductase (Na(+)-transporting) subunit D [bacterium]|nr:NADH:ubiquinone reductase (Na(+)-transporting) subunit D [bacterium]
MALLKSLPKPLVDPLVENNPITIQVLGICSALAVTVQLKQAVVMSCAVIFVLIGSNFILSLLRKGLPNRIRIIVEMCVIAALVILVDQVLRAYFFELSKQLSVFVGLIITNCIVLGRAEAFALGNSPGASILDGLGNGLGYSLVLCLVGTIREIFGSGTIWGFPLILKMGEWMGLSQSLYDLGYENMGLMVLPPGAFIIIGLYIWAVNVVSGRQGE